MRSQNQVRIHLPISLRWRLTLTYAGLLAATLLLAAAGGLFTLRTTLYSGLDDSLRAADRLAGQLTANITPPRLHMRSFLILLRCCGGGVQSDRQ